jgi:hypothetical protein
LVNARCCQVTIKDSSLHSATPVDTFRFGGMLAGFKFTGAIVQYFWHHTFQMRVNSIEIDGMEVAPRETYMKAVGFAHQVEVKIVLHSVQKLNVWRCWSDSSEANLGNKILDFW